MSSCFSPVILSRAAKLQAQQLSSSIGPRGSGWSPQEQPQQHLWTQGWKVQQQAWRRYRATWGTYPQKLRTQGWKVQQHQAGRRYRHNSCPQALGREAAAGPHRNSHSNTWQHRDGRYNNRHGEVTGTTVVLKHWAERQRLVPTGAATATPGNTGMEGTTTSGREKVQGHWKYTSPKPGNTGMEGTTSGREKVQGHWKYTSPKTGNKKTYLYMGTGLQCWGRYSHEYIDTMCTCGKRIKPAAYQTEDTNEPLHMK